jgi:hypothetical protein
MTIVEPTEFVEIDPIEIDSRPCGECGLTIDRHRRVDTPEGPEFFCIDLPLDEMTLPELERRAELIRQVEVAAIFARLETMDDPSKRLPPQPVPRSAPYRTPQSTIDAFWYVVGRDDTDYLRRWLARHPLDAPHLLEIWERKNAVA